MSIACNKGSTETDDMTGFWQHHREVWDYQAYYNHLVQCMDLHACEQIESGQDFAIWHDLP